MTNEDDEQLADLLLRWEELRELGQDTSAADLCPNQPHLVEELARRINALKATSWLDDPIGSGNSDSSPDASPSINPRTLLGRYRLDDLIATGGFAQVWRAYDQVLQRIVAVKVPRSSRIESADAFMAEARRVARLKHPGIVPVFDVGREGESCFIVSEFAEGGSLGDHLARNPPSQQQAIRWIIEIADALDYAHLHGVVHRDIKPANILIDHHGSALLADFGIAQSASRAGQTTLSLGTLRYMSPEQLEGKVVDPHSDIFSLGVVLHEVLVGSLPYSSSEPNILRREIISGAKVRTDGLQVELVRICQKALERDSHLRYTSASHMAADLRRCLEAPSTASNWKTKAIVTLSLVLAVSGLAYFQLKDRRVGIQESKDTSTATASVADQKPPAERSDTPRVTTPKPMPTVDQLMATGRENFDKSHFDKASEIYSQVIEIDPSNAEVYDKRGACQFNSGSFNASLADFNKAIDLAPANPDFLKHRALSYASLRQFDSAIADIERAISLTPPDSHSFHETAAIIYSNRAAERSNAKQFAKAANDVTQAIKHLPAGNVFYHQRGSCYFNMKEYEKALVDFTEAIRREPNKGAHYLHRGYCLQALGRGKEAATAFERAKSLGEAP